MGSISVHELRNRDRILQSNWRRNVRISRYADSHSHLRANMDCQCKEDGFCQRYQRVMNGRLRKICQGIDIDPGAAAAIRAAWNANAKGIQPQPAMTTACPHLGEAVRDGQGETKKKECVSCGGKKMRQLFACNHPAREPDEITMEDCSRCDYRPKQTETAKAIILRNHLSPGDVLVMSAAIHSLHKANPGKFLTAVDTTANALYENNPDVITLERARELNAQTIETHYPAVHQSNDRGITFMQGYCEFFAEVLNVPVPLLTNRPHVYLSTKERSWMDQVQETTGRKQKFWLICAGRKNDFTTKFWGTDSFQRVVDSLRGRVLFVQVGSKEHHHPPLRNVLNLIGKTDQRQLVRLAWHSEGILSGVTFLQHLAAALQKPSVVVMGGREPVQWNSYPKQSLLHTVGLLSCCRNSGCWKSRVVPLNDGTEQDKSLCENPVIGDEAIPKCMAMIKPEEVAERILLYA